MSNQTARVVTSVNGPHGPPPPAPPRPARPSARHERRRHTPRSTEYRSPRPCRILRFGQQRPKQGEPRAVDHRLRAGPRTECESDRRDLIDGLPTAQRMQQVSDNPVLLRIAEDITRKHREASKQFFVRHSQCPPLTVFQRSDVGRYLPHDFTGRRLGRHHICKAKRPVRRQDYLWNENRCGQVRLHTPHVTAPAIIPRRQSQAQWHRGPPSPSTRRQPRITTRRRRHG